MSINQDYDVIVIGSGMAGMSVAALLANDGYKVLILEAALHPGGCSSSYKRKGYVFESGATTLIGFDENQPLRFLEEKTGIEIPRVELNPSMKVWLDAEPLTRYKDRSQWVEESIRVFGNRKGQKKFWNLAFGIADVVWKVSLRNTFFPPRKLTEWIKLFTSNSPTDVWVLPYAFKSVNQIAKKCGVATSKFLQFLDEQLMITAQAKANEVPFLFGAAGLTYTNYSNFYVPGGLLQMIYTIRNFIEQKGGKLATKQAVIHIENSNQKFILSTKKGNKYQASVVISNAPIWNMGSLVDNSMKNYFDEESTQYDKAWGALTVAIATTDTYPNSLGLHHQIHLNGEKVPYTNSTSIFVSMSARDDTDRAPKGERTLNISCHASPEYWFKMNGTYNENKENVKMFILKILKEKLPGFSKAHIKLADIATPVTWQKWVYRKKGRVGGIPQSMARSLLKWTPTETPFQGLYLVGDTTYPGQGIPGVTLSGINVYSRVKKNHPKTISI